MQRKTFDWYVRAGLWALPIYGVANLAGTLSSQPDYHKDFPAYARYVHTSGFLASHLLASMLGTAIGLIGFTALFVYLANRGACGLSVTAFVTTILGNVAAVAMFGVAAFAQSAIGKAFLAGHHDAVGLNASVYGTAANLTGAAGVVLLTAAVVLFAVAISRSRSLPRNAGVVLAASVPIFAVGTITGTPLATVGALMEIGSAIWIARSASRSASPRATAMRVDEQPPVLAALDV